MHRSTNHYGAGPTLSSIVKESELDMLKTMELKDLLPLVTQLSVMDKVRLIEVIAPQITQDLETTLAAPHPRSLWGLTADLGSAPSMEDISEVRHEMWANFPREDIS